MTFVYLEASFSRVTLRLCWMKHKVISFFRCSCLIVLKYYCRWCHYKHVFERNIMVYMHVVSYCMVTFLGYGMHAVLIFFIPFVSRHCVSRSGHITFPSKDCMLQDFVIVNYFMHAFALSPKDIVCFGILTGETFWMINKYSKHNLFCIKRNTSYTMKSSWNF